MKATKDLLEQLHGIVAEGLIKKLESGEATASDYAQAIKFLKDNGIEAMPTEDNPLGQLSIAARVPFSSTDDTHH